MELLGITRISQGYANRYPGLVAEVVYLLARVEIGSAPDRCGIITGIRRTVIFDDVKGDARTKLPPYPKV